MSKPMSANQFHDLMRKWKIPFDPYKSNWASHNRNHTRDNAWEDVNGVMLHHTGPGTQSGLKRILWNGYSGLPGPLCNVGNDEDGVLVGIGWGRANHAGLGDDEVFRNVIAEDYGDRPGYGKELEKKIDGNSHFYGTEVMYSGSKKMSNKQYVSMVLFAAAICDWHDWTEKSTILHGEWQPGKWDPGYRSGKMMSGKNIREDIKAAMKAGPGNWSKKEKPEPEEDEVTPWPSDNTHTIKKGDTLWGLADKYLGTGKRWPELVANNIELFPLPIGKTIKIPEK